MAHSLEGQLYFTTPILAPHLRDWAAMKAADHVIILDTWSWSRKGRSHRMAVNVQGQKQWLGLQGEPTQWKGKTIQGLQWEKETIDSMTKTWFKSLEPSYKSGYGFDELWPEWLNFWHQAPHTLVECTLEHGVWMAQWLGLQELSQKWLLASALEDRVFQEAWFRVDVWMEPKTAAYAPQPPNRTPLPTWTEPRYRQRWEPYVEDCSGLDLLFEWGPESWRIIDKL
ncbi:MAG: hypothetical protein CBC65_003625 [Rhodothermaceae bacterium TMED105]|nr:MAG: hypothetical protein CBC65_003625 [Rhodothermaceae bacterium TMED105]|tara:strand:- start:2043 stop:2720 length:678 start_codon:yes stop_codon:yes gene_type:complete